MPPAPAGPRSHTSRSAISTARGWSFICVAARAARTVTSCSAPSCWMRCASTGADSSTSRPPGCFPADAGAPRTVPSTPRWSGWPAGMLPNEPVWNTGTSIRIRCVIALPHTCSKAEPTCAPSRCCWDIAISKRPRSTCTSRIAISAQPPAHWIPWQHQKILLAITRCRTAALGGHRDRCSACGHTTAISYNSCRDRHCPRCQANARVRWLQARERELLPTRYVHLVFTLPRELAPLALQNKRVIYNLLFEASAATLLEIARDPRHLGAEIGFFSVLHTWNQRLQHHPHVHCVAAAGGLAPDHTRWISSRHSFFLPVKVLSRVFRSKFVAGLKTAFHQDKLEFHGHLAPLAEPRTFAAWLRSLFRHDWVVYAKPPFGGPEHALRYLSGYTHRVAISNRRLVALEQGNVTFPSPDSAHANRQRARLLPLCCQSLAGAAGVPDREASPAADHPCSSTYWNCPVCGGSMHVVERLSAAQLLPRSPPLTRLCAA